MRILKFFLVLLITFVLVCFVMNKSISSYLEQRYHIYIALDNEILDEANSLKIKLEQIKTVLSNDSFTTNYEILQELAQKNEENLSLAVATELINDVNNTSDENLSKTKLVNLEDMNITVKDGEEFLIIGDSLMQGVALSLVKDLQALDINSTNLSKQNTGLSYKSYFNWAKATQAAFLSNDKIKYVVVLLGANDPWAIKLNNKYHQFNTTQWLSIYTSRVNEILQIAKNYGARVFWYEIPPVKDKNLNTKLKVLNQIYKNELANNEEIFIQTQSVLSDNGEYSSYVKDENNKSIKVRADDGTHFNIKGAKIMSNLLLKHINK
ncbi:putative periplasmic SGNH family hydrolase [Campylobacter avium LMG 24591]|uniref:Putative periplasmic SGNH family hydrolase n=1 Tax=Campylobacter avium LMG 24591 TaxID=522484 RepID=A0A222MXX6_9BACT|nr:DUF459 domain-containing protein [Campylobacter avium]ASQ30426.1 putative periplasmic SGNH family hydrolase [Campylobacter avium LMG 24591]